MTQARQGRRAHKGLQDRREQWGRRASQEHRDCKVLPALRERLGHRVVRVQLVLLEHKGL